MKNIGALLAVIMICFVSQVHGVNVGDRWVEPKFVMVRTITVRVIGMNLASASYTPDSLPGAGRVTGMRDLVKVFPDTTEVYIEDTGCGGTLFVTSPPRTITDDAGKLAVEVLPQTKKLVVAKGKDDITINVGW